MFDCARSRYNTKISRCLLRFVLCRRIKINPKGVRVLWSLNNGDHRFVTGAYQQRLYINSTSAEDVCRLHSTISCQPNRRLTRFPLDSSSLRQLPSRNRVFGKRETPLTLEPPENVPRVFQSIIDKIGAGFRRAPGPVLTSGY